MVGDPEGQAGLSHRRAAFREPVEGVKGAFVHIVAVDPEQRFPLLAFGDRVRGPQLIDQVSGSCAKRRVVTPEGG